MDVLNIESLQVGEGLSEQEFLSLQPRKFEGCFGWVDESGVIDIYLIQDQMPFWLLEFFNSDLTIAFGVRSGVPLLVLRYRHFQVMLPIYNRVPTTDRLNLCILELNGLEVQKINSYRLSEQMSHAIEWAVQTLEHKESESVYEGFDAIRSSEVEADLFERGVCDTLPTEVALSSETGLTQT